jgi:hypothetical protein
MADLKHVGRIKSTGRKCLVVFRTLPGDSYNCLVVATENLPDSYHDALIQLVESPSGQQANEFAEVLSRSKFPDGSTMLPALHTQGKLLKVPTDQVEMTPNFNISVPLNELNQIIAEQMGVAVDDLAIKEPLKDNKVEVQEVATVKDLSPKNDSAAAKTTSSSVNEDVQPAVVNMTPEQQAKHFRSEADRLSKQAAEMRRKAEELVPIAKKKSKETVSG